MCVGQKGRGGPGNQQQYKIIKTRVGSKVVQDEGKLAETPTTGAQRWMQERGYCNAQRYQGWVCIVKRDGGG